MGYSINGETKIITLTSGTTNVSVRDLWSRWVDWVKLSDNSKYLPALVSIGGVPINEAEGTFIPVYAFLINGWRIKPQEANHTLNVNDGILLVSGGGDPFINTTGDFVVRINYQQPVQAISFSTSGGSATIPQEVIDNIQGIMDILQGDVIPTASLFKILHKVTKDTLVEKNAVVVNGLTQLTE